MTRDETKELLMTIQAIYPNFKVVPSQMTATINAWHLMLEEYPADSVNAALKIYAKTNNSGFAPSVSQLIGGIYAPTNNDQLSEGEAWNIVKKAIKDSGYHAQEHFDNFPPIIQRAVGSPTMLREWGMTDSDEVNTVIMSNFQRTYRALLSKQDFNNRVPDAIADVVRQVADKVAPPPQTARIESWEDEYEDEEDY